MGAYERAVLYFSTVLVTATMYAPQPIATLLRLGFLLCVFDGFASLLGGMIVICAANF